MAFLTSRGEEQARHCATSTIQPSAVLPGAGQALAFSPDKKTFATVTEATTDSVRLWNIRTHKTTNILTGKTAANNGALFSPDGRFLIAQDSPTPGQGDPVTVHLLNVSTGKTTNIRTGQKEVVSVAVSPDGKTLATVGAWHPDEKYDNPVRLWDIASRSPITTLPGHTNGVWYMEFSPDGKALATASKDKTVRLWNVATRKATATIDTDGGVLSPDGTTLAASDGNDVVRLWNMSTGKKTTTTFTDANGGMFSPDGTTFASFSKDGTVRLWDVDSDTSTVIAGDRGMPTGFSPSGKTLAITDESGRVRLWDVATRKPTATLSPSSIGWRPAFGPDGKTFASADTDGTVRLWDVADCS